MSNNISFGSPVITMDWLLSIANKGKQPYGDAQIEVQITHSDTFDADILSIVLYAINPYSTNAHFGGGFASDATDEDCLRLAGVLDQTIERMRRAEQLAGKDPLHMVRQDADTLVCEESHRRYGYELYQNEHFSIYAMSWDGEWDHPVGMPVILDGKLYKSLYSFWLGRPVYMYREGKPIK